MLAISGLSRGFSTCCLRFKSGVAITPAKLASGWLARLYREGVEPSGSLQKVSDHILVPLFWIYPGARKAGCPSGAFLGDRRLKPAPDIRRPPSSLHPPFVHFVVATVVRSELGLRNSILHRHAVEYSTYPRGPRSGPGCSVPVRHHLIGPIRPTRGHIAISPHGGLYAMPSLCGSA